MSRDKDKGTTPQRKLEREMKLGTITSRRALMEREKAMEAARNPGVSKFGDCLVNNNLKTDKVFTSNIRKINSEIRRMQLQINHKKKFFLKNSNVLNHDPIILVERPPSPEVIKRAYTMMTSVAETGYPLTDDDNKPSYMRELRSKARTPSTLRTIDAFTIKQRKKKNVWEGAVDDLDPPEFKGTVRPFAKLTNREKSDLKKGYEFHKPKLESTGHIDAQNTVNTVKALPKKIPKVKKGTHSDESDFDDEITPFITQMSSVRNKKGDRKEKTIAEINLETKSPILAIQEANSPVIDERTVRFKSPVTITASKSKHSHGTRAKATKITLAPKL